MNHIGDCTMSEADKVVK